AGGDPEAARADGPGAARGRGIGPVEVVGEVAAAGARRRVVDDVHGSRGRGDRRGGRVAGGRAEVEGPVGGIVGRGDRQSGRRGARRGDREGGGREGTGPAGRDARGQAEGRGRAGASVVVLDR